MEVPVTLDSHIRMPVNVLPDDFVKDLKDLLTFDNPEYQKAMRMGTSTYGIEKHIRLWREDGGDFIAPRGVLAEAARLMKAYGLKPVWIDRRSLVDMDPVPIQSKLRSYQKEALSQVMRFKSGVIVSPAGSGKTVMGVAIVAASSQKTLWVTHTLELAHQARERFEQHLGIDGIGFVGDGQMSIGERLTIGMVQTLSRMDLAPYRDEFGAVIVDEAHRVPADTFRSVADAFSARYRIGLTATPYRADGLHPVMFSIMGPILFETTHGSLSRLGHIVVPSLNVVYTDFYYPYNDHRDWHRLMRALAKDPNRNMTIVSDVLKEVREGKFCLVLTTRKDHCIAITERLKSRGVAVSMATSDVPSKEREEIRQRAQDGDLQVLVATQLADEGLDLPQISALFLIAPQRNAARIEQRVGRCMRPAPGKPVPVVYDYVDANVGLLANQFRSRIEVYEKLGIKVSQQHKEVACAQ